MVQLKNVHIFISLEPYRILELLASMSDHIATGCCIMTQFYIPIQDSPYVYMTIQVERCRPTSHHTDLRNSILYRHHFKRNCNVLVNCCGMTLKGLKLQFKKHAFLHTLPCHQCRVDERKHSHVYEIVSLVPRPSHLFNEAIYKIVPFSNLYILLLCPVIYTCIHIIHCTSKQSTKYY